MRAALCLLLGAAPASAESALDWLVARSVPVSVGEAGTWVTPSGTVLAADPLTLFGIESPISGLPETTATVLGFYPVDSPGRTALMALIWSDAPVVCGEDVSTIGVDTGLAAFLAPSDVPVLLDYMKEWDTLYAGSYAEQIDTLYPGPMLIDLPGASGFPLSGSGWGDGGYPVATLKDEEGQVTALYTQFITGEDADWLLPTPCEDSTS
ncbi:hypothetical protein [Cognatiyoonia sp. IB215182]|uniref:hypothetical protein n=1 Tax=Cognatiyoonia sp. IB215182 TaxID=3097353 RepID=UPI002A16C870|nr:hypothetical protein [Cognatiyoonia sp. IB215182]MDX8351031.1 hypothetical protein [Cognatiyoonia sp. IB215182]